MDVFLIPVLWWLFRREILLAVEDISRAWYKAKP